MHRHFSSILVRAVVAIAMIAAVGDSWADAGIISVSGQVEVIPPPPSVRGGDLESDTFARIFPERQGVVLPAGLSVDITVPGSYATFASLTPGVLPAGALVDSFLVHADPISPGTPVIRYIGSITFDTDILGLLVTNPNLRDSDSVLGAPGTLYPLGGDALELDPSNPLRDSVVLSPDRRTVSFDFRSRPGIEEIRVVTSGGPGPSAVPEPSTLILLALGGVAFGAWQLQHARRR